MRVEMEEQQRLPFLTSYSVWYDGNIPATYEHNQKAYFVNSNISSYPISATS